MLEGIRSLKKKESDDGVNTKNKNGGRDHFVEGREEKMSYDGKIKEKSRKIEREEDER
jgi:hypothetical protein